MSDIREITITEIKPEEVNKVARLLADSMCTNPNHLAIYKSTSESVIKKQHRMFEMVLHNENNKTFVAKANGKIVGAMSYTTSESCQMKIIEIIRILPKLTGIFGRHLFPVLQWRMNWAKHDYSSDHIHFGPLAVAKEHQGKGIGKALLKHFCNYLDISNKVGYLETDKAENVALYELFGFKVIGEDTIWGNPNWFMLRDFKHL